LLRMPGRNTKINLRRQRLDFQAYPVRTRARKGYFEDEIQAAAHQHDRADSDSQAGIDTPVKDRHD
jgi:hypothetical protein